jgi:hypothetical protein
MHSNPTILPCGHPHPQSGGTRGLLDMFPYPTGMPLQYCHVCFQVLPFTASGGSSSSQPTFQQPSASVTGPSHLSPPDNINTSTQLAAPFTFASSGPASKQLPYHRTLEAQINLMRSGPSEAAGMAEIPAGRGLPKKKSRTRLPTSTNASSASQAPRPLPASEPGPSILSLQRYEVYVAVCPGSDHHRIEKIAEGSEEWIPSNEVLDSQNTKSNWSQFIMERILEQLDIWTNYRRLKHGHMCTYLLLSNSKSPSAVGCSTFLCGADYSTRLTPRCRATISPHSLFER